MMNRLLPLPSRAILLVVMIATVVLMGCDDLSELEPLSESDPPVTNPDPSPAPSEPEPSVVLESDGLGVSISPVESDIVSGVLTIDFLQRPEGANNFLIMLAPVDVPHPATSKEVPFDQPNVYAYFADLSVPQAFVYTPSVANGAYNLSVSAADMLWLREASWIATVTMPVTVAN